VVCRLGELALREVDARRDVMRLEKSGVELESFLKLPLRFVVLLGQRQREPARDPRLGEIRVELHGLEARALRLLDRAFSRAEVKPQERVAVRNPRVGAGVLRVDLDRAGEHLFRNLESLAPQLAEELSPLQVVIVRFDVAGFGRFQGGDEISSQRDLKRLGDASGDLVLDREDVLHVPLVLLGPEPIAVVDVDEPGGHPHSIAGFPHASLENRSDVELVADLPDVHRRSLELER